ncbi:MAG: diaminobutyrate--2-oxoglutarate transaminase [Candidatus Hydrogenedens sp.]|nr:diaminobutyrate--2-oxoglutarate transaminase [Candidatus Hydrogenedens sp.]
MSTNLTKTEPDSSRAIFEESESNVRGYCRSYPVVFTKAQGATLTTEDGDEYLDFLAGAGSLNYGHNNWALKDELVDYIVRNGLTHGLDMHSAAKRRFMEAMRDHILRPREMNYKMQFTGPTGTNAVEAAFKLARKVAGRTNIVSFTNGFHGVTLGSVAATGNSHFRNAAGVPLGNVTFMPYDGYLGKGVDTTAYLDKALSDGSSGLDKPAAVIVETIQGEGGVNVASNEWLRSLERVCNKHGILLIADDIQVGCGRTGTFFSFEAAGIEPDIITLSKSLSGYGLPLSLVLMKPKLDQWKPGEHNGTFRGNNMAFITAAKAIETFWSNRDFARDIKRKSAILSAQLERMGEEYPGIAEVRGRGLVYGVECEKPEVAAAISAEAFKRGMIIETSGAQDQVVKFLPPLTIETNELERGLEIFEESLQAALAGFPEYATELKAVA